MRKTLAPSSSIVSGYGIKPSSDAKQCLEGTAKCAETSVSLRGFYGCYARELNVPRRHLLCTVYYSKLRATTLCLTSIITVLGDDAVVTVSDR